MALRIACLTVLATSVPLLAGAQPSRSKARAQPLGIVFNQIANPDTAVHPLGNRPALHQGQVAFYGYRGASFGSDVVVALRRADGKGPFTILAAEGEPRPDEPGSRTSVRWRVRRLGGRHRNRRDRERRDDRRAIHSVDSIVGGSCERATFHQAEAWPPKWPGLRNGLASDAADATEMADATESGGRTSVRWKVGRLGGG